MTNQKPLLSKFLSFLLLSLSLCGHESLMMANELIPVGVVLDLKSPVGRVAERYMSMALSDFYAVNHNYSTRLSLLTKDSGNDVIAAASAALDLMKKEEVQAIIGPQSSAQARFVIELGRKARVPIISFSATSPSLSPSQNKFFIRIAQDDSAQVKAIADIVKAFGWPEIVLIYEDTEYGNSLIPHLMDTLQLIDTHVPYRCVIPPSSNNTEIIKELSKLKENYTRIFLVHMSASLGSKLFALAKNAKMMSEGYAWMVTEGLSSLLDPMSSKVMDSMQGVLGIRPYLTPSKQLEDFERKWKRNLTSIQAKIKSTTSLNWFGLWAYDTIWALAMAVEKAGMHSRFFKQSASGCNADLAALDIFENGTRLRNTIANTTFEGLSGNFGLVNGQLEPSTFEVFNVIGKTEINIGYWTSQRGFSKDLKDTGEKAYSTSKDKLKPLIWPGYTIHQPPSRLRIGVLVKNGFTEFVKVEWNSSTDDTPNVSGFSIEVFFAPLSLNLWLTTGVAFIFTGFVIWVLEHRINTEFRGPPAQQLGLIFWFSFSTLAFAHREKVVNNWSRFVLVIWIFLVLILTQSYTASLTSILTVQRLQPMFVDIKEIKKNGYFVGYQKNSFVKELLKEQFDIHESKLKPYETPEEYHEALSNGTHNGGVAAIFDEIPYLKIFLSNYPSKYTTVFPQGSPFVPHMSRAILNVTQNRSKIQAIENKYFPSQLTCEDQNTRISPDSHSLGVDSFGGLFLITGIASTVSLLVYVFKLFYSHWPILSNKNPADSYWSKLVKMAKHFDQKDLSSHTFKGEESRVHAVASPEVSVPSPGIDDMSNHTRNSTEGLDDVVIHDDNGSLSSSSRHGDTSMQDVPNSS
ncbi:glutamate receptor 2.2 [Quercus suber]|uniref:Glutamate receptor n=1 Tax=Quercus suber TaxID=58331 RepID=A0AAW0JK14_QUESU